MLTFRYDVFRTHREKLAEVIDGILLLFKWVRFPLYYNVNVMECSVKHSRTKMLGHLFNVPFPFRTSTDNRQR